MSWSFGHRGTWNEVMEKVTQAQPPSGEQAKHFDRHKKMVQLEMQSIHDDMMSDPNGHNNGVDVQASGHWDKANCNSSVRINRIQLTTPTTGGATAAETEVQATKKRRPDPVAAEVEK
jgi:hypothetical protein